MTELRIIGAEFADRYSRPRPVVTGREPCIVCQDPTGDCTEHREPRSEVFPADTAPPPFYDNPPTCPTDGRLVRADEQFTPQPGPAPENVYTERWPDGARGPSFALMIAKGQVPDLDWFARRNRRLPATESPAP